MKTAQIVVTSCSRRELELGQVRNFLAGNGFDLCDEDWFVDDRADLILLSTCGFTQAAEDFGFETLHRINREKKATAQLVLCGCIPEINPARTEAEFGGPAFSPQSYSRLNDIVAAETPFDSFRRPNLLRTKALKPSLKDDLWLGMQLLRSFDGSFAGMQNIARRLGNGLTRKVIRGRLANIESNSTFYIQIQEGCSMECSYCSIRTAIGRLRSRPMAAILEEFQSGLRLGYKEFQLVGDNAGSYGLDIGTNMGHLLAELARLEGDYKLDLTDINPVYLPLILEPFKQLASQGRIARLYVPVQSGSPRILKLMNRGCDTERVKATLREMRAAVVPDNGFRLGTSIIAGFPGETPEDLQQTIDFCRDAGFDWVWCHSFSARPETPAAQLEGRLPAGEILARARLVKKELSGHSLVAMADDSAGSRTCQG